MNFIGRREEFKILKDADTNDSYEEIAIYGQCRVGKNKLV